MRKLTLLLALLIWVGALAGQTVRGTIAGTVTDETSRPLGGATVTLIHLETGRRHQATTNAAGDFVAPSLVPGEYRLEAEHAGYQKSVRQFPLLVNQEIRVDLPLLAAGRAADTVEVTSVAGLLRESGTLATTVDTRQVATLPLDGRNLLELSLLAPGAVPAAQGSAGSVRGDFALNVNGSREDSNNFLLDGVYNGDPKLNTFGVNAAVDAIREFELVTSSYDASFGRNAGAQMSVVTKSGTNQIHGTAYEFLRNAALDSRNYFAPASEPDPRYQRNQFGFSLGGPVQKDKTFLFGDFEGRRVREGITQVTNVPTALERMGDFSKSGLPYIIDPFTQAPFPGNVIPSFRLDPVGRAISALYPLPNRNTPGQNFVSSPISRERNDQFDARLDRAIGKAGDLSVRYSFSDRSLFEPFTGPSFAAIPGYGDDVPRRSQNAMASESQVLAPELLNEFRAAFTRVASRVLQQNRDTNLNRAVGLPTTWTNPRDNGLSLITLPGFSPIGDEYNNPQSGVTNTYQVLDHMTWSRGRHLIKAGGEFRRLQQNAYRDIEARGLFNFYGFLGSSLVDLLQGLPVVTGYATLDNPQYLRTWSANFFVNDTWRLAPRFTLSLGMRYEYNAPAVDRYDHANLFDPAQQTLVAVGKNGFPRSGYDADHNNLAPRLGFGWQVSKRTVVRGGYGIYYDQSALAPGEGLYFSPPYFNLRLFVAQATFPLFLQNPYPSNYPYPTPPSASAFQRDLRAPYMQHWNLSVQRQLGSSRVVELGYVASKGTKLFSARDINQPGPSAAEFNPRPNFYFQDVNILESRANSVYQSLQSRLEQRFAHGVSALASYTWGKSIDDASGFFSSAGDPNFPQDSRNPRAERALSNFDARHRFTAAYTWDLPLGKGSLRGGWQTAGIWTFQSGRPFTVALLPELDNSGTGRSNLGFGANDRPNVLRNPMLENPTPERWFDTSAFAIPSRGTFGSAGRNIVSGPGLQTIDVSLLKTFRIAERATVQFRAEAFNLLNRTNLNLPDIYAESPTFGRISSAGSPRHVQAGLKLLF